MSKRFPCVLGLVAAFALVGCGGRGADTATVTGKVTLPNGSPLPGGRIDFRQATSGSLVSGQIKEDGTYEAPLVPQGDYKVSIENSHLRSVTPRPRGLTPLPGSDQKYVVINPKYAKPETSGLTTTVSGKTHLYDVQLR